MDYKKILKSVTKVEDDQNEYYVSSDQAIEAMELAVEKAIPIILKHVAKEAGTYAFGSRDLIDRDGILNQSEPIKKKLGI